MRQPWQCVQFLPGVRGRGNAFFRAAEQHDVTTDIQGALDLTCWHGRGHWKVESKQCPHSYTKQVNIYQGCSKKKPTTTKRWRSPLNDPASKSKILKWKVCPLSLINHSFVKCSHNMVEPTQHSETDNANIPTPSVWEVVDKALVGASVRQLGVVDEDGGTCAWHGGHKSHSTIEVISEAEDLAPLVNDHLR